MHTAASVQEEVIAALPEKIPPIVAIRGTVLSSSFGYMRAQGMEADYWNALAPEHHEAIRSMETSSWLPMDVTMAHYDAMVAVFPNALDQRKVGAWVSERVQNRFVGTIIRGMAATGIVTPARLLARVPSVWNRVAQGGAVGVFRIGPRELRLELHAPGFVHHPYVRNSMFGAIAGSMALLGQGVTLRPLPSASAGVAAFAITWA